MNLEATIFAPEARKKLYDFYHESDLRFMETRFRYRFVTIKSIWTPAALPLYDSPRFCHTLNKSSFIFHFSLKPLRNHQKSLKPLKLQYTHRRLSFHNIGSPLAHPKPRGMPPCLIWDKIRVHRIHFRWFSFISVCTDHPYRKLRCILDR